MRTLARAAIAAAMLVLATVGVSLPATAAAGDPSPNTTYGCLQEGGDYGAQPVCQLQVKAASVCVADASYLDYALTVVGSPNDRATITWIKPGGPNIVLTDQPLTGRLLWPGTVLAGDGTVTDYAGWTKQPGGAWVEGDEFSWTRPSVQVLFEVNPSAVETVAYPPATAGCNPPTAIVLAAEDPSTAVLSATGSNVAPLLFGAAGLVGLGALLLLARTALRRKKVTVA